MMDLSIFIHFHVKLLDVRSPFIYYHHSCYSSITEFSIGNPSSEGTSQITNSLDPPTHLPNIVQPPATRRCRSAAQQRGSCVPPTSQRRCRTSHGPTTCSRPGRSGMPRDSVRQFSWPNFIRFDHPRVSCQGDLQVVSKYIDLTDCYCGCTFVNSFINNHKYVYYIYIYIILYIYRYIYYIYI